MPNTMQETRLPNGKVIYCLQKREVPLIYEEVQTYFEHGVSLKQGDVVFDVGANIGLFTLRVTEQFGRAISVHAFEPIPAIFEVLSLNVQRHDLCNVTTYPVGLSKTEREAVFAYYPSAPVISTAFPDGWKEEMAEAVLHNPRQMPAMVRWLSLLPIPARSWVVKLMFRFLREERMIRPVTPLSKVMREGQISRIDLLKIDAEKSELDVLLGINDEDWGKIYQIVVEVHDNNGRVGTIEEMLTGHGFGRLVLERGPVLKRSNVVSIFAVR
jgi:FkbM family methyltransferase